jgi:hypothetical protein
MARDIENQERQHPHIWRETSGGDKWVKAKFPYDYKIIQPYLGRLVEECPEDIQRLYFELEYYLKIAWANEPDITLRIMASDT